MTQTRALNGESDNSEVSATRERDESSLRNEGLTFRHAFLSLLSAEESGGRLRYLNGMHSVSSVV